MIAFSKKLSKLIPAVVFFLSIFLFTYLFGFSHLDPDFGWHLKTGELILSRGIPKVDWYSFTMPDFPWINHEWLTDVLFFKAFSLFGYSFLIFVFIAISLVSFLLTIKKRFIKYYLFPLTIGYISCFSFFGVRPQFITLFFLSVLLKILDEFFENKKSKLIFFLPILFLVWVNLHGGFSIGLFVLSASIFLELLKKTRFFKRIINSKWLINQNVKESEKKDIIILSILTLFSFFATLINPYGLRIYEEVFRTISDAKLTIYIYEWQPLFLASPSFLIIFYISFFILGIFIKRKKIEFRKLILAIIFFFFTLLHIRHFPLFVIVSLPILAEIIFEIKKEIPQEKYQKIFGGGKQYLILWLIIIFEFFWNSFLFSADIDFFYPSEKAIFSIKTIPPEENIFNEYNWGGYLIWRIPNRRFFIDGRMPSWRKDGKYAFGDYIKIREAKEGFYDLLNQYQINFVVLQNNPPLEGKNIKMSNFLEKYPKLANIFKIQPKKDLREELIKHGWRILFEDKTTIILWR